MKPSVWTTEERGMLFRSRTPTPVEVRNAIRHAREVLSIGRSPTVVILRRELEALVAIAADTKPKGVR